MNKNKLYCCCIECGKEYSHRGINSHYFTSHTEDGRKKIRRASLLGAKKGGQAFKEKAKIEMEKKNAITKRNSEKYYKDPKICLECNNPLKYESRNNTFCSNNCAITNYNKQEMPQEIKMKISNGLRKYNEDLPKFSPLLMRTCMNCSNSFLYSIERAKHTDIFNSHCSHECLSETRSRNGRNNHGLGTRRSKDEIALYELISSHYNNVLNNYVIADGWDSDIVILDKNIAIFWNGPWHYKEMGVGNHSLKQVQNRDRIKTELFKSLGWTVIIYEDRYYTPSTAFADIINRVV